MLDDEDKIINKIYLWFYLCGICTFGGGRKGIFKDIYWVGLVLIYFMWTDLLWTLLIVLN